MLSMLAMAACLSGPSIKGDASPKDLDVLDAGVGVSGTFKEDVPAAAGAGAAGVAGTAAGAGVDGGGFAAAGVGLGC